MEKMVEKEALPSFVEAVLEKLQTNPRQQPATLLALEGDLGAGKTTFTQALAQHLGITEPVTSPTFTILQSYPLPQETSATYPWQILHHIDAYRLEGAGELRSIGFAELLTEPALIVLEWPQNVSDALPECFWRLRIAEVPDRPQARVFRLDRTGC